MLLISLLKPIGRNAPQAKGKELRESYSGYLEKPQHPGRKKIILLSTKSIGLNIAKKRPVQ